MRHSFWKRISATPWAIVISLLLHFGFCFFIVITLKPKPLNSQPTVIFLGSILQGQDLVIKHPPALAGGSGNLTNKMHSPTNIIPPRPMAPTTLSKPNYSPNFPKNNLKPVYAQQKAVVNKEEPDNLTGLEEKVPAYNPLKLEK